MDDRELIEMLENLEPRRASSRMDEKVMAASKDALHQMRTGTIRRRRYAWAGAAAVLLISSILFQALIPDKEASTGRTGTVSVAPPCREAFSARARLLELKLARLKRLAALTEVEARYSSDLEYMDRVLKDVKEWAAPRVWLDEFLDVLATSERNGLLSTDKVTPILNDALALMQGCSYEMPPGIRR
jgi:hypothetical protein